MVHTRDKDAEKNGGGSREDTARVVSLRDAGDYRRCYVLKHSKATLKRKVTVAAKSKHTLVKKQKRRSMEITPKTSLPPLHILGVIVF